VTPQLLEQPSTSAAPPESTFVRDMRAMHAAILATTSVAERQRLELRRAEYMRDHAAGGQPVPFTALEDA
jgi:hypothetical protein